MSRRSADPARLLAAALVALALAGCASSPPRATGEAAAERAPEAGEPVPEALASAYDRALAALETGDDTEAELELKALVLEYPDYAGPYVNLAIIYLRGDRESEADEALARALELDPASAPAYNELGILRRRQGRFADAEQAYRAAISADSDYALAYLNLGVLLDLYLKRGADALASYEHYQSLLESPDETVAKWIIDLKRRVGAGQDRAAVAKDDAS